MPRTEKKRAEAAERSVGKAVSLRQACALIQLNRSTVYKQRTVSPKILDDAAIVQKIRQIQQTHHYTYGIERVTAELRSTGLIINHKRVARLMRKHGLNAVIMKKRNWQCSVPSVKRKQIPANILNREFRSEKVGEKLVSDVTYLPTNDGGWCYVSLVKDLASSEIVACATSKSQTFGLGLDTLRQLKGKTRKDGVFHTDQGYMYTHPMFGKMLCDMGLRQSLSRKGNCLDNAVQRHDEMRVVLP